MRSYQAYHQGNGFVDVAYHFFVDRNGNVYEGRPLSAVGDTFTEYDPTGHLLPCLDGNFEEQDPTPQALESLALLLAWGCSQFGVEPRDILADRDVAATLCPGAGLYQELTSGALEKRVSHHMGGGAELKYLNDRAGMLRVDAIEAGQA